MKDNEMLKLYDKLKTANGVYEGNTKSKDASKVDNKKESEKEYIKLYVGKENVPDIESKNSDT
ncbi:hypothetical protein ACTPD5_22700, partial [Clostridioides difficile]